MLMKFYERPEFKALNAKWRAKLARSFDDLEDHNEHMRPLTEELNRDPRVNVDYWATLEFFLKLDAWLQTKPNICIRHRRILEIYSTGKYTIIEIAHHKNISRQMVTKVIAKAKRLINEQK